MADTSLPDTPEFNYTVGTSVLTPRFDKQGHQPSRLILPPRIHAGGGDFCLTPRRH